MDERLTSDKFEQAQAPNDGAVSNIFRTRSSLTHMSSTGSLPRLSATTSAIPIVDEPQPASHFPHWTIQVPFEDTHADPLLQTILDGETFDDGTPRAPPSPAILQAPPVSSETALTPTPDAFVQRSQQFAKKTGSFFAKDGNKPLEDAGYGSSLLQKGFLNSRSAEAADDLPRGWQAVDVDVFSLGSFAFKGMAGQWQIAQVLPSALTARLELFSHVLKRGKATCTRQDDSQLHSVKMWLPEISGLQLAR